MFAFLRRMLFFLFVFAFCLSCFCFFCIFWHCVAFFCFFVCLFLLLFAFFGARQTGPRQAAGRRPGRRLIFCMPLYICVYLCTSLCILDIFVCGGRKKLCMGTTPKHTTYTKKCVFVETKKMCATKCAHWATMLSG